MFRHQLSPIACVALLLIACGEDESPKATAAPKVETSAEAAKDSVPPPADDKAEQAKKSAPKPTVTNAEVAKALEHGDTKQNPAAETGTGGSLSVAEAVAGAAPAPKPSTGVRSRASAAKGRSGDGSTRLRLISGFDEPMAVVHHSGSDVYLVSNLNSQGAKSPGIGYVSRVSPAGSIIKRRWIDGATKRGKLRTPRGMAVVGGKLYVADGDVIRIYDSQGGRSRGTISVKGASQFNGLTPGPSGSVFAADSSFTADGRSSGTDAVYQVSRSGRVEPLFKSSVLGHPSSVARVDGVVWISTLGSGKLHGLDRKGRLLAGPRLHDGRLAGLKVIGKDDVVVTSRAGDSIYRGSLTGKFTYLQGDISSPGHPGWDAGRRRLLVPSQETGQVHVLVLAPPKKKRKRRRR